MHIRVIYYDGRYDYVTAPVLNSLLSGRKVKAFFRPLERKWAWVGYDRVRGAGGVYVGPERRQVNS